MSALSRIRKAGFDAFLYGESFKVFPASKLTQSRREFLKAHKAEIMAELQYQDYIEALPGVLTVTCYTPGG